MFFLLYLVIKRFKITETIELLEGHDLDKRALSDPAYVRESPMPYFFIASRFGEPGKWPTHFNFLKHIGKGGPLEDAASDDSWRRQQKRIFKKLRETHGETEDTNVSLSFGANFDDLLNKYSEHNKSAVKPVTFWWLVFAAMTRQVKEEYPDSPLSYLLMFLTTLENRKFDNEEMLMWMLCAYLEWIWLDRLVHDKKSACGDSQLDFVPIDLWKPVAELGHLCTTRFRVMDELFDHRDDREFRHRCGRRTHGSSPTKDYRKLNVRTAMRELREFTDLKTKKSMPLEDEQYQNLFSFVHFFEWVQLDMLANGVPASRIELSFSRINEIQFTFQSELDSYFKEHSVFS